MDKVGFEAALRAIGASIVKVDSLPKGPGIFDDEVGGPGPWYGIEFEHGYRYGWVRDVEALYDSEILIRHVGANVVVDRMSYEILRAARESRIGGMLEAAGIVRYLRPSEACTCGGYLSFHNGVPSHQPGCLVGECIEAADEIEGRAVELESA